jgi:succinyl-CoA synthetase beta subunit
MSLHITELTFLQSFADRYGIPIPRFLSETEHMHKVKDIIDSWGGEAIVKPDVLSGKRGKAGAVSTVTNAQEALREIKRINSLEINGKLPRTAYLVEKIPAEIEVYTAITYNSLFQGPSLTISLMGGIDIEDIPDSGKRTIAVDIFKGLDAYQVSETLESLQCPQAYISSLSQAIICFWDLFSSTGFEMAEINPWRITPDGKPYACDFKALLDENNYKSRIHGVKPPEFPDDKHTFDEEMQKWDASSHQGQAHVSYLGGTSILPILFGGGASTIVTETLEISGGSPIFLSDFGGNPPYERMKGTAEICFRHFLDSADLLLILGGKANNTFIDITFQAIADALIDYSENTGTLNLPVIIGRGGPRLVKGLLVMKQTLEYLNLPYVIFGPDTPITMVAEYASRLADIIRKHKDELP